MDERGASATSGVCSGKGAGAYPCDLASLDRVPFRFHERGLCESSFRIAEDKAYRKDEFKP